MENEIQDLKDSLDVVNKVISTLKDIRDTAYKNEEKSLLNVIIESVDSIIEGYKVRKKSIEKGFLLIDELKRDAMQLKTDEKQH